MGRSVLPILRNASKLWLALPLLLAIASAAHAAGPVETSVFAVQGVAIDVTDTDAATAKNKAIIDVQVQAFQELVAKYGPPEMVAEYAAIEPKEVMTFLKSLSVEEEAISPGRYAGKFTVRFLPNKVGPLFVKHGVKLLSRQTSAILVLPVWNDQGTTMLWEDNPWRNAWINLGATQAAVPIVVALGDAEDQKILSAKDMVAGDAVKLEALRRRYDVAGVIVATGEPEGDGVRARIDGVSPIGTVKIDKIYIGDGSIQSAADVAAKRFQTVMVGKFNSDESKLAAASNAPKSVPVAVPFASPSQWNGIRSRILATPGVRGVDVTSLDGQGAVIKLIYAGELDGLQSAFQSAGLELAQVGETWIIQ